MAVTDLDGQAMASTAGDGSLGCRIRDCSVDSNTALVPWKVAHLFHPVVVADPADGAR